MEIFKGTATFSGIAIGKILYYSRGEYQIRQSLVSNIKKEIEEFQRARSQAAAALLELYEKKRLLNEQEAKTFLNRKIFWNQKAIKKPSKAVFHQKK